jgi:hypothetical protein
MSPRGTARSGPTVTGSAASSKATASACGEVARSAPVRSRVYSARSISPSSGFSHSAAWTLAMAATRRSQSSSASAAGLPAVVLHAVVHLPEQHVPLLEQPLQVPRALLGASGELGVLGEEVVAHRATLGDVPRDGERADGLARGIADHGRAAVHPDEGAVLSPALALGGEGRPGGDGSEPRAERPSLVGAGVEGSCAPAQDLVGRVAEERLGPHAPEGDAPFEVHHQDRVLDAGQTVREGGDVAREGGAGRGGAVGHSRDADCRMGGMRSGKNGARSRNSRENRPDVRIATLPRAELTSVMPTIVVRRLQTR